MFSTDYKAPKRLDDRTLRLLDLLARHAADIIERARILLVEDEEAQRVSTKNGLERLGYRVTDKADGSTALAAFRKKPDAFDVVITDQIMPKMSGLELAEALVILRPDVPIILCTGFSEKVNGAPSRPERCRLDSLSVAGQEALRRAMPNARTARKAPKTSNPARPSA